MSPEYRPAAGLVVLILALFIEQMLWDETMNQSPDELSVAAFEVQESSLATVLADAIDTAQGLADNLSGQKLEWELAALIARRQNAPAQVVTTAEMEEDRARQNQAQAAGLARILEAVKKEIDQGARV